MTVTDRLNRSTLSRSLVCPGPSLGALTPDETAVLVLCAGSRELAFLNTAAFDVTARVALTARPTAVAITADGWHAQVRGADGATLALVDLETGRQVARLHGRPAANAGRPNELVFLGMIHGEHRTSQRYGLDVVRRLVEAIDPDYWLTEIPPNRLARAVEEFARTGGVAEPRVSRFPEYVDVLFPLSRTMRFRVYGTAGWSHPMDRYRRERLAAIAHDPQRAAAWKAYQAAIADSEQQLASGGAADDPRWIHTDAYDAAQRVQLDVYNDQFDAELGTGGWNTINRAHFAHITRVLDQHTRRGRAHPHHLRGRPQELDAAAAARSGATWWCSTPRRSSIAPAARPSRDRQRRLSSVGRGRGGNAAAGAEPARHASRRRAGRRRAGARVHRARQLRRAVVLGRSGGHRPVQQRTLAGLGLSCRVSADAVLVSHPHYDHDASYYFPAGTPVIRRPGATPSAISTSKAAKAATPAPSALTSVRSTPSGSSRPGVFAWLHLGDNGPVPAATLAALGRMDVAAQHSDAQSAS